jgi:pilus assembly protein Flp/PilA
MIVMELKCTFRRLVTDEGGQDLIEYALLAVFISIIAVVTIQSIGEDVNTLYGNIDTETGSAAAAAN